MKYFCIAFGVCFSVIFPHALAADCSNYLGKEIKEDSIENVISLMSKMPRVKDEFERTSEFDARIANAKLGIPEHFAVSKPLDPKYITYDADKQKLTISSFAIDNLNTSYDGIFGYGTPLYQKVNFSSSNNIDLVISSTQKITGSYNAINGFGAKFLVSQVSRSTKVIFSRQAISGENLFFPSRPSNSLGSNVIIEFPNTNADVARRVKGMLRAVVLIAPKAPFYAEGRVDWDKPTLSNPQDIDEKLEVIFADFQCVLFTDQNGKVYGSVHTR